MTVAPAFLFVSLAFAACGGGGESSAPVAAAQTPPPAVAAPPIAPVSADITILMMGNSHTSTNHLPETLAAMLRAGKPGKTVAVVVAPGSMFLEERFNHAPSIALLQSQPWSFVILQAQKYSTSGMFVYSTTEAEQLVRMARSMRAVPIMFPEWPRFGIPETATIYDLHASIAFKQPACVAPIGQAWDLSLMRNPGLTLHSGDGNHSAAPGAFLAALVLYATLTGGSPAALPTLPIQGIDANVQSELRNVATETVQTTSPRKMCPNDPVFHYRLDTR